MPAYLINPVIAPSGIGARTIARCSTGQLWCTYLVHDGANDQVWVSHSDDDGSTWVGEQLTFVVAAQYPPSLAVDSNNNVHIAWHGRGWGVNVAQVNIQYRRRIATGWEAQEAVTDEVNQQTDATLAIGSDDRVHVVWECADAIFPGLTRYIRYRRRTAAGWDAAETVAFNATRAQFGPVVAIGGDNTVNVAWFGAGWPTNPATHNIQYRRKIGASWQAQEAVTDSANNQDDPATVMDSADNVYLTWTDIGVGLAYRRRIATGWEAIEHPAGAVKGLSLDGTDAVYVLGTGPPGDIAYMKRDAGGWQAPVATTIPLTMISINFLWANHPTVNSAKSNVPVAGFALVYQDKPALITSLYYFTSAVPDELVWVVTPTVTTEPATLISQVSATINGILDDDGGEACQCGFEWGLTDAYGHTTLTESKVTGETFSRAIGSLTPGTTYHFRAFATNSAGTGYGADMSFTTTPTFSRAHALSREEL